MIEPLMVSLLPRTLTVIDFSLMSLRQYRAWRERFDEVYGYTINTELESAGIVNADIGHRIFYQNVTKPFTPRCYGDVAYIYNTAAGLTDGALRTTIENMAQHAPIHIFHDNLHTHRVIKQSYDRTDAIYAEAGWKQWSRVDHITAVYVSVEMYYPLKAIEKRAEHAIRSGWSARRARVIRGDEARADH